MIRLALVALVALFAVGCSTQPATDTAATPDAVRNGVITQTPDASEAPESSPATPSTGSVLTPTAPAGEARFTLAPNQTSEDVQAGLEQVTNTLLDRYSGQTVHVQVQYEFELVPGDESVPNANQPVMFTPSATADAALAAEVARDATLWVNSKDLNRGELVVTVQVPTNVDSAPIG